MKIRSVTPWIVEVPVAEPGVMFSQGQPGSQRGGRQYVFVQVETDEGLTGWGEITGYPGPVANRAVCAVLRELGPLLAGQDAGPHRGHLAAHLPGLHLRRAPGASPPASSAGSTSPCGTSGARPSACPSTSSSAARCGTDDRPLHPLPLRATRRRRPPRNALVPVRDGHRAIKTDPFVPEEMAPQPGTERTWTAA